MLNKIKTIVVFTLLVGASFSFAQSGGLKFVETASGTKSSTTRELVQWTHSRLVFEKELTRVAVGQNSIMEVEVLNGREVLVLAKDVGRTSLIVWYPDETTETFLFSVTEDLSVLRRALGDIHPDIRIDLAPDRAALVLRGNVPSTRYKVAAEAAAKNYFAAGGEVNSGTGLMEKNDEFNLLDLATAATGNLRLELPSGESEAAIINLIRVEALPMTMEAKIMDAIKLIGGENVEIERIQRGDVENNAVDTLLLKGTVENQVSLTRIMNIAAKLFANPDGTADTSLKAIADESGSLIAQQGSPARNGGSRGSFGSNSSQAQGNLSNNIAQNIGRAKMLSAANGRILSVIEVKDLPQVRVSVQLYEVDRVRMKNWRPELTGVTGGFRSNSMSADGSGLSIQPDASERIGATESRQVENALQILGGTLSNQLQVGGSDIAFDLLFSLLESEGISRTLSKPTLTVLAGETALFQVGGEVPVPTAFAPAGVSSGDTGGVFSGTEFKAFGVQLEVRAMVGEDDRITMDVRPTISTPDASLTQTIAGATGSNLSATAFTTRSLDTTTRLRDSQPLVIGGLVSRDTSQAEAYTPGLHKTPLLGKLAQNSQHADTDKELIIVVTPTIIREPIDDLALWQFPSANELLELAVDIPEATTYSNPSTQLRNQK